MQFSFLFGTADHGHVASPVAAPVSPRVIFVRHRRAKRYVLRVRSDGAVRVTVPRGGTVAEAGKFVERNAGWIQKQLVRQAVEIRPASSWGDGEEIWFRGERVPLAVEHDARQVRFGVEICPVADPGGDLRPCVERYLRTLASRELPSHVLHFSGLHGIPVRRVTVRNQRSRWGSCSRRGTVSLNWRLIQTPTFVRDYIILHELAHFREMNHSRRFWREVEQMCPAYEVAEQWLKQNRGLLGDCRK